MPTPPLTQSARLAGALYAVILLFGLGSELAVRARLVVPGDAAATWERIAAAQGLFRAGIAADAVMLLADVGLAVILYGLLRPVHHGAALAAMALRLLQAALIGASLLAPLAVLGLLEGAAGDRSQALRLMTVHAAGYDLGLVFFGANTVITAWLLARSGWVSGWLPPLLGAAGLVYLAGSLTRILAPELNAAMQPAYLVPVVAETAVAIALLRGLPGARRVQTQAPAS